VEGGALGTAVIDHFRRRGAHLIATTHYDSLKSYASTTGGVWSARHLASIPETFAPTYKLIYGSPGRSLAIEIAKRLGMPADCHSPRPARISPSVKSSSPSTSLGWTTTCGRSNGNASRQRRSGLPSPRPSGSFARARRRVRDREEAVPEAPGFEARGAGSRAARKEIDTSLTG
jgi:hypothetical protein